MLSSQWTNKYVAVEMIVVSVWLPVKFLDAKYYNAEHKIVLVDNKRFNRYKTAWNGMKEVISTLVSMLNSVSLS